MFSIENYNKSVPSILCCLFGIYEKLKFTSELLGGTSLSQQTAPFQVLPTCKETIMVNLLLIF